MKDSASLGIQDLDLGSAVSFHRQHDPVVTLAIDELDPRRALLLIDLNALGPGCPTWAPAGGGSSRVT